MTFRVFEAFSWIGTQRMSLRNLGIEHEVVAVSEIDRFAIASYEAIHGETFNLGDISKLDVNEIPDHDLFTYSFPCQDISVAGQQAGLNMGSGTRSGSLWECQKVITAKKPKYLLLENVKNLIGKRHKENFDIWLSWLSEQGYTNYWQVLNAKDFGVPQNRERVFVVSILGEHKEFSFPSKQELQLRLKDMLEDEVDEKFYLSDEKVEQLLANTKGKIDLNKQVIGTCHPRNDLSFATRDRVYSQEKVAPTLTSTMYKDAPKVATSPNRLGGMFDTETSSRQAGAVWDKDAISPTLDTMQGGWRQPSILIKNATKQGYLEANEGDGIDLTYPNSQTRRGRVQKEMSQTLQTGTSVGTLDGYRIRKLTPLECWRLMGISDEDFYKAQEVNSNSQLYKQAGNSIVVQVLEAIFKELLKGGEEY